MSDAPERIWASYRKQPEQLYAYPWKSWEGNLRETEYVRADLHDALAKERDELHSEVERLRELADLIDQNITENDLSEHRLILNGETYTGPAVDWAHKVLTGLRDLIRGRTTLQRKEGDE